MSWRALLVILVALGGAGWALAETAESRYYVPAVPGDLTQVDFYLIYWLQQLQVTKEGFLKILF